MKTSDCIAMLLAGGEGRRLAPLTNDLAKPVVPFGGRCRIIDYTLSNCVHSGIRTIGVLTQYKAESVHDHIGDGTAWQREERDGCSTIELLPSSRVSAEKYAGTADALYQNMDYIDRLDPAHVLVLAGDHIYRMDYREMLASHKRSGASATIAVKQVPWKDTGRFGIISTDEHGRIAAFAEKPIRAASNTASLGIYIFRWADLRRALLEDRDHPDSSRDFGKDIIPRMLDTGYMLMAYPFEGYWRDVGTVESLWEAHMDIFDGGLNEEWHWPVLTRERKHTYPSLLTPHAVVRHSYIHHGSYIEGSVERSVVFGGVAVGRGTDILESIVMPDAQIGRNVRIIRAIIGERAIIEDGSVIGSPDEAVTVIGAGERVEGHGYDARIAERIKGSVSEAGRRFLEKRELPLFPDFNF
ncbi:sugar phosphate nucleotidyltransferase [Paenibacillus spongiae]|uniref:NTP transferase domain-containing protein n=1 Tax=Paenibacillus spongiae TaxID=2909671 RepID=A0ABY5SH29_9BACL|nr:sugar phosphate nucleotidyltransferase [Paenibacillus spongiae]UVI31968.1 NTP transferase domain-containing protein [Paenibacillus spongiae]